jgi:hypothetical protein
MKAYQEWMEAKTEANNTQKTEELDHPVAILERLGSPQKKMEAKMDANQEIMEAKVATIMDSIQERMETMIKTSH